MLIYHTFSSVQNTANHPQANTEAALPATSIHTGPTLKARLTAEKQDKRTWRTGSKQV